MRCICCYNKKYPCGFMACPECGGMASEGDVEEYYGRCEDCENKYLSKVIRDYFRGHLYLTESSLDKVVSAIMDEQDAEDIRDFLVRVWGLTLNKGSGILV